MTPAARLQHVIDILGIMAKSGQPVDRLLKDWFRTRRYAGSKDRAAIGERVFAIQRQRAAFAWRMQDDSPRALAIASVLASGEQPDALFTGDGYGPPALTDTERAAIATTPAEAPLSVRGAFPAFLEPELRRAFGDNLLAEMEALNARAPVDLRVNTLRGRERGEVLDALVAQGLAAQAMPHARNGIRIASGEGTAQLRSGPMFESGAFEFQDEAAQIAAILCGAEPNQRVLDLAAGAGGKSLALAAAMQNTGEIVACDIRQPALQELAVRAKRANATNIRTYLLGPPPEGLFDIVLIDAPCTGTGTWRRQPELRWKLTPQILAQRIATQDKLLDDAAQLLKPRGRLIYATCSILPSENQDRVAAFLTRHPQFITLSAAQTWREETATPPPPGMAQSFTATPRQTGTDGFFTAILARE